MLNLLMYLTRHPLAEVVVPNDDRQPEFKNPEGYKKHNFCTQKISLVFAILSSLLEGLQIFF